MKKGDIANATENNLSTITTGVKQLAEEADFNPYLQAVITSSQRTRSILYVWIIALIAIFAAYRNTAEPDWIDGRLQQLQMAYSCMQNGEKDRPECGEAIKYARNFMYQSTNGASPSSSSQKYDVEKNFLNLSSTPTDQNEELREIRYQIDMLMRQRTENLAIRIPLLGLAMDMNDLGWISGNTLFVLTYIFLLTLRREEDNLNRARIRAEQSKNKDNLELLLMVQVFSSPSKSKTGTNKAFYLFFAVPFLIQLLILRTDIGDTASILAGSVLMSPKMFWMQMIYEILFLAGIAWLSLRSGQQWGKIDKALNCIHKAYHQGESSE
jgi:hypothetical protein